MSEHSAVAVFQSIEQAKAAMNVLDERGIRRDKIVIISHELESKQEVHGLVSGSDQDATGAFKGVLAGGAIGLIVGAVILGLVSTLTPFGEQFGVGIIAGGVMGFILAGMIFGAIIGGMTGRGVKEANIEPYDAQLKAGKALVIAHGTHDEMHRAQNILKSAGAIETKVHHHVTAPADTTEAL